MSQQDLGIDQVLWVPQQTGPFVHTSLKEVVPFPWIWNCSLRSRELMGSFFKDSFFKFFFFLI